MVGPLVQNFMKQIAPPSSAVETPEANTTVPEDSDFERIMEQIKDEENLMFDRFYLEAMADENKDGKIDAREVVERLKAMVIEQLDDDKDGAVSEQELRKVAGAIFESMGVSVNDGQIEELFRALDKNGDGEVTPEDME